MECCRCNSKTQPFKGHLGALVERVNWCTVDLKGSNCSRHKIEGVRCQHQARGQQKTRRTRGRTRIPPQPPELWLLLFCVAKFVLGQIPRRRSCNTALGQIASLRDDPESVREGEGKTRHGKRGASELCVDELLISVGS